MVTSNITTRSDVYFYQKIIHKYQPVKRNPFRLPLLIFLKNPEIFSSKKINMDVLIRFNIQYSYIFPSMIVKSVQNGRNLLSWLNTEKLIQQSIEKKPFRFENIQITNKLTCVLKKTLQPLFSIANTEHTEINQKVNYDNYMQIYHQLKILDVNEHTYKRSITAKNLLQFPQTQNIKPGSVKHSLYINRQNIQNYHHVYSYKSPAISWQSNLFLNTKFRHIIHPNLINKTVKNWTVLNKHLTKQSISESNTVSFSYIQRKEALSVDNNFSFHSSLNMQQEIEKIKKIVKETREVVAGRGSTQSSNDGDIRHHSDIHRISDQVYQMIDRRIKIEKERRGYL